MTTQAVRKNQHVLRWIRGTAFGIGTTWALASMSFTPGAAAYGLGIAVGVLAMFSPGLAVLVSIIVLGLPIVAADFVVGVVFIVIGFAAIQYLGQDNGRVYLFVLYAFIASAYGPAWVVAVVAGYLMGASEGVVVALVAALVVEMAGLASGRDAIGVIVTGGTAPGVVDFTSMPDNLLTFGWIAEAVRQVDPGSSLEVFAGARFIALLFVQPVIWGASAVVTGLVRRPLDDSRRQYFGLLAAFAGVFTAAAASAAALATFGAEVPLASVGVSAGLSVVAAAVIIGIWEWVFPPIATRTSVPHMSSMEAEDADVDELLRLISTAEDQLASKHTTEATVMITDMKSFSAMTEEEGSVISAKTIQRHRDLLLPVIASYHGNGKSTGGDGLVAAFNSAGDAVHAAVTMQRTLREHNAAHKGERDIFIRVGIANGEVVLDRGGRPFIGNALNLAARVMNLGDGGQVFTTRAVLDAAHAGDLRTYRHGSVELKNIADPVEVYEVLWDEGQEPGKPRGF